MTEQIFYSGTFRIFTESCTQIVFTDGLLVLYNETEKC